ncbi:MAG TPA: nickel pincer cofactor biosynthesis protein LarB [Anaerohalosphaeraceae bacterium]|nr:nickel pincer cofactor biosynthesis protein LarB [Anaerohalosphaeraceae bacterium]
MDVKTIETLLEDVKTGRISIQEAVEKLRRLPFEDIGIAQIDHHRSLRCGFPEVIFCPFKTKEQIREIFLRMAQTGHNVLATRASEEVFAFVSEGFPGKGLSYDRQAKTIALVQKPILYRPGYIAVVTAGTADLPAAFEARVTAELFGSQVKLFCDVGVAGLHRLLNCIHEIRKADVVIVAAGMEGALASVVGGLVDCPVIAIPTSVGYGAAFEGLSALLTMLNSCAAGITVVNIDNGFGAAVAACLMHRKMRPAEENNESNQ